MSSDQSSKQAEPNPHFPRSYFFGQSLDEYLTDNPTTAKLISRDENTAMTLWKSKDGTKFMLRLFFNGDCKAAIVMDANEFDRVVKQLLEATSDEP